jgi:hypothetical protein
MIVVEVVQTMITVEVVESTAVVMEAAGAVKAARARMPTRPVGDAAETQTQQARREEPCCVASNHRVILFW